LCGQITDEHSSVAQPLNPLSRSLPSSHYTSRLSDNHLHITLNGRYMGRT
jgi:hypothetical protein